MTTIVFMAVGVAGAACGGSDTARDRAVTAGVASTVPDTPPDGFATAPLAPATPRPALSDTGPAAPGGSVWYKISDSNAPGSPHVLEWYVRAQHLAPGRVFRVEMGVDVHSVYSVGSARADSSGLLVAHGTLPRFADQYCVGNNPTPPVPLAGTHHVSVNVKRDGSGTGPASPSGPLTDPGRMLPCGGNSDGNFDYWLVSPSPFEIGQR